MKFFKMHKGKIVLCFVSVQCSFQIGDRNVLNVVNEVDLSLIHI